MKRIFTLITILALACTSTLHAAITAGENQLWWGYMGNATGVTGIGVSAADTYHCAIFLPGNHDVAGGKSISAVRFALTAPSATDVKVWIASALPDADPTESNTLWVSNVANDQLSDATDVALPAPLAIPEGGVYVGYSFTITNVTGTSDRGPVLTTGTDAPNGLILRTDNTVKQWSDMNGQGFGVLSLKVLLEGSFPAYSVSPTPTAALYYAQMGQTADVEIALTNNGRVAVDNLSYTITTDGNTSEEQTITLSQPLPAYSKGSATISVMGDNTVSTSTKTITITKINGNDNLATEKSTDITLSTLEHFIPRNVVVEEFTGTGCGYCPRGLVGMEKLRQTFGDRFIGIGIHQYNSNDAMYIANYANLGFTSAPSCSINRGETMDPYTGLSGDICNDVRKEMALPASAEVSVAGVINEAETEVNAKATITSLTDLTGHSVAFVLVADGLSGSTTAWVQTNYYANQQPSQNPEDLRQFCSGGKYGQNNIVGYVFNDVAISSSYVGINNMVEGLGTLKANEPRETSYTLNMPTKATLRNACKKGTIYVVALLIDDKGRIANAAKSQVLTEEEQSAILTVDSQRKANVVASYSLDGKTLKAPQRGINIVKMDDGSVRKVFVK